MNKENSDGYLWWGFITGIITFVCIWIYAIAQWGLLFGLIFGWIPALIGGFVAGLLWPLVLLVAGGILFLIIANS